MKILTIGLLAWWLLLDGQTAGVPGQGGYLMRLQIGPFTTEETCKAGVVLLEDAMKAQLQSGGGKLKPATCEKAWPPLRPIKG